MNVKSVWSFLKDTMSEFGKDRVLRLAAALSYYSIFSIGPLLLIAVGLAGLVFGADNVRHELESQLQSLMGANASKVLSSMAAPHDHSKNILATILGIVALLAGASGVFGQLQDSLNTIWKVQAKPGGNILDFIRRRFLSLSMVLGIGFLLLVSMILSTVLSSFTSHIGGMLPLSKLLAQIFDFVVSFAVITLLFAAIFKFLPDVHIPWSNVWFGAVGTSLMFSLGKYALSLYLGRESTASPYGLAGSVIVILLWFYYSAVILFVGAEFTQVHAKRVGAKVVPNRFAVSVPNCERAEQGMDSKKAAGEKPNGSESDVPIAAPPSPLESGAALAIGLAAGAIVRCISGPAPKPMPRSHRPSLDRRPDRSRQPALNQA